jgi:hypothetical protein
MDSLVIHPGLKCFFKSTILSGIIVVFFSFLVLADEHAPNFSDTNQVKIQNIFNKLEAIGTASNNGTQAAKETTLGLICQESTALVRDLESWKSGGSSFLNDSFLPSQISNIIQKQISEKKDHVLNMSCAALQGQKISTGMSAGSISSFWQSDILPEMIEWSEAHLQKSNIPLLSNIEITAGGTRGGLFASAMTIEPLWVSENEKDHIFTQISWHAAPNDETNRGYKKQYDTMNAGLVYRKLSIDDTILYGGNFFIDYAPDGDHWRSSIGVDAQTSQLGMSINRYVPLSTWQNLDDYYEERASSGWDLQMRGQVPELPNWTGLLTGFQWDFQENGKDQYGIETGFEYSPVPAFVVRTSIRDDNQNAMAFDTSMRFQWKFNEPADIQWRPRTELIPVKDRIYTKVNRDNIIRVSQRRRNEAQVVVIENIGINSVTQESGSSLGSVGQILLMPATISVANSVGAIMRVQLHDGSILSAGQNTQVRIEPRVITLISGTIQFTSNGSITTVSTPGATITLHGTDLDVVSNGVDSSVRLRDGSISVVGSVLGASTLSFGQMAESISGNVGSVSNGSGNYITHTDQVSRYIDRIGAPQTGSHVTPYPSEPPVIQTENLTAGQSMIFRLRYNQAVDVSGTPRLQMTINGHSRTADYVSGSGTTDLLFTYTVALADAGVSTILVTGFDLNGGGVTGGGKTAITTIADTTLTLSGSLSTGDITAPTGYVSLFTTDPINNANKNAIAFSISSAEVGAAYNYTISSSGGGTNVTGSGTAAGATVNITGIDATGLNDGTLTVSVTMTDSSGNVGSAATDTVVKDIIAPTISSVAAPADGTYEP